ncbi:hypothetical protein SCA6_017894 [Theobroma cacao]
MSKITYYAELSAWSVDPCEYRTEKRSIRARVSVVVCSTISLKSVRLKGLRLPCSLVHEHDLAGGEQICDESPTAMMEGAVDVEKFILGRMFI